jgi:2-haloacid dehalogenase
MIEKDTFDFDPFEWITFDCYGTLIDWETGIKASLLPVLASHGLSAEPNEVLELYGQIEAEMESESRPCIPYRDVLAQVVAGLGKRLGFVPSEVQLQSLADSLHSWKPFPDTVAALQDLKKKYKLGIISNTDDDLFAASAKQLGVAFDMVVTAQQAGSYKPALNNFRLAIKKTGVPKTKILHAGQSIYHDIVPAKILGLANVWVNRRSGKDGLGATKAASAVSDLEVPNLRTFAAMAG